MFIDTIVGFRVDKQIINNNNNHTISKMYLQFTCNYCEQVLDVIEILGSEIRHPDTYSGIEGFLQLHWMGCDAYRKVKGPKYT